MRFPRHDGIYRSDVSLLLVNPADFGILNWPSSAVCFGPPS